MSMRSNTHSAPERNLMIGERKNHPIEDRLAEEAAATRVRELERENAKLRTENERLKKRVAESDAYFANPMNFNP
jgi:hypothetical protein